MGPGMQDACQARHPMTGVSHAVQTTTQATHEEKIMHSRTIEKLLTPRACSSRDEDRYLRKSTCDICNEPTYSLGMNICEGCQEDAEETAVNFN